MDGQHIKAVKMVFKFNREHLAVLTFILLSCPVRITYSASAYIVYNSTFRTIIDDDSKDQYYNNLKDNE